MSWLIPEHVITALLSGGGSFVGVTLRWSARLKTAEDELKALRKKFDEFEGVFRSFVRMPQGENREGLDAALVTFKRGWNLAFTSFRDDMEFKLQDLVKEAVEKQFRELTPSKADLLEDVYRQLKELSAESRRQRDKSSNFVRNEAFAAFTKQQEEQWREVERAIGRLEGILKTNPPPR